MSHLADLIRPTVPSGLTIPEPLERAWTWMESQGWGFEARGTSHLTPYEGRAQLGIVFSSSETLTGWFEPGEPGHDRLVPLGQTDGTGSLAALWLDPTDTMRFVLLGSEGERLLLADDAVDFLRLIAIGYLELADYVLPEPPDEDEDAESVAALADFRAWVENELGVEVPEHWSVQEPDPFSAWVDEVKPPAPVVAPPVPARPPFTLPDLEPSGIATAFEELLQRPRIDGRRIGRHHGLRLTTAAWGHELSLVETSGDYGPEHAPHVAGWMEQVRSAFGDLWGTPRALPAAAESWVANKALLGGIETVDLWDADDEQVVVLFTSATEGIQVAAVVTTAAVDVPADF